MRFMTVGIIDHEHMQEAYSRFKKMPTTPIPGIDILARVFEADGHKFWVYHDSDSALEMSKLTRGWEDICEFTTVPVLDDAELLSTLK